MGAEVTVFSHSLGKAADGKRMGADHFYATSDPATFTPGDVRPAHITVSAEMDWNQYLNLLKVDGAMVLVGIAEKQVSVERIAARFQAGKLAGSAIGSLKETQEMLDFCGRHNITCDIELTPIQKVNECWERMREERR